MGIGEKTCGGGGLWLSFWFLFEKGLETSQTHTEVSFEGNRRITTHSWGPLKESAPCRGLRAQGHPRGPQQKASKRSEAVALLQRQDKPHLPKLPWTRAVKRNMGTLYDLPR